MRAGEIREYNALETLTLLLTCKSIIHMKVRKKQWEEMGNALILAFDQIGYNHRIEHVAPRRLWNPTTTSEIEHGGSMKVIFQSDATAEEKVILDIVADSETVLVESDYGVDFANELKDL